MATKTVDLSVCGDATESDLYNCRKYVTGKVKDICDSKQTCLPDASNDAYGDPCQNIRKYLNVTDQYIATLVSRRVKRACGDTFDSFITCKEPQNVEISPDSVLADVGQSVTLTCTATSDYGYVFEWMKDSKVVGTNVSSITISNTQPGDAGLYICIAKNSHGRSNASRFVNVSCGGNFTSETGQLTFPGKLDTLSKCNYLIKLPADHRLTLAFTNRTGWSDSGYNIKIYNGNSTSSGTPTILFFISKAEYYNSSGNTMYIQYTRRGVGRDIVASYNSGSPPVVERVRELYNVHYGQIVTLQCMFRTKFPIIAALMEKIVRDDRVEIIPEIYSEESPGNMSLRISNANERNAGTYRCLVKNKYGIGLSDNFTLIVEESKPVIFPVLDSYNILYGQSVTLQCNYTSYLPIITAIWQKHVDGDFVNITTEINANKNVGSVSLTILKADRSDGGKYRCLVSNRAGFNTSDNTTVFVQDKNECGDTSLNTCEHDCVNTFGSYECRCWRGYTGVNGRNCLLDYTNMDKYLKTLVITVSIEGPSVWNDSLQDSQTPYYKKLESQFVDTVNEMMKNYSNYKETMILSMRPGSIVVDFAIIIDKGSNDSTLLQTLQDHVSLETFGSFRVKNETVTSRSGKGYIYEIDIDKNFTVHEGTTLSIPCTAGAISLTGNIDFEWKLNGSEVRPLATSRIQIIYNKVDRTHYNSTLVIKDIQKRDAGTVQCAAVLGEIVYGLSQIYVYRFTIGSTSQTVRSGSSVAINCSIHPPTESAKNTLKMCKDGTVFSDTQLIYQGHVAILKLDTLSDSTSIGCGWKHEVDCTKTINIDVYTPSIKTCQAEYDSNNITWSETVPGATNYQPCPAGFKGLASRQCLVNNYVGQWTMPSFVNCTRDVFVSISEQLERIQEGVVVNNMVNILRTFSNESETIMRNNESTVADIRAGVDILTRASEIVTDRKEEITAEESQEIFVATNTILQTEAESTWDELNQETSNTNYAAQVMTIVSNVSNTVLKSLPKNESINIVLTNMVLQIKHKPIGQIIFPDSDIINDTTTNIKSQVILSKETIEKSLDVNDTVEYSAVYYKTISQLLPKIESSSQKTVGSPVVAFTIPKYLIKTKLNPPVQLSFETLQTNFTHRECSYWNFDLPNGGSWATEGCEVYLSTENMTECRCNHLTNFAVLLSLNEIPSTHHEILSLVSLIGCIISIICVVLTLIVYTVEWKNLSSDKSVILVLMCIVLLISYITFLVGIEKTEDKDVCTAIAVSLHFLFLVVLFLMAAEGIIHAVMVISIFPQRRSINRILLPFVFGIPTVIVVTSAVVTRLDGFGTDKICWISTENGLIYAFFGPCLFVVLMNFVITGLVLRKLFSTRATMSKTRKEKLKTGIRSIIILAPVFGLTWLFGLLSFSHEMIGFAYCFVIFNSLQGFFIFLLHGIMNENVKKSVKRRASRFMKQQDYLTFTKSTESTNTWNVFKKVKPRNAKVNRNVSDLSNCCTMGATSVMNPTYNGVSTDAPVVELSDNVL